MKYFHTVILHEGVGSYNLPKILRTLNEEFTDGEVLIKRLAWIPLNYPAQLDAGPIEELGPLLELTTDDSHVLLNLWSSSEAIAKLAYLIEINTVQLIYTRDLTIVAIVEMFEYQTRLHFPIENSSEGGSAKINLEERIVSSVQGNGSHSKNSLLRLNWAKDGYFRGYPSTLVSIIPEDIPKATCLCLMSRPKKSRSHVPVLVDRDAVWLQKALERYLDQQLLLIAEKDGGDRLYSFLAWILEDANLAKELLADGTTMSFHLFVPGLRLAMSGKRKASSKRWEISEYR